MRNTWKFETSFPGSDYVRIEVTEGDAYCDEIWTTPLIVTVNGVDITTWNDFPFGFNLWTDGDSLDRTQTVLYAVEIHASRIGHMHLANWAAAYKSRLTEVFRAFAKAFPEPETDDMADWLDFAE